MKYLIRNQLRLLAFFLIFFLGGRGEWGSGGTGVGGESGREGGGEVTAEKSKSQMIYYY